MKRITLIAAFLITARLHAADNPLPPADPFAGAFFPPEVIVLAGDQVGLTKDQRDAIRDRVEKTKARSGELMKQVFREMAALSTMAKQPRVDEAALLVQLDRVLDAEREMKHLQMVTLVSIKNTLTPDQQAKLREVTKGDAAALITATRDRLTAKVDRVRQLAQKMAASGRDPIAVVKMMDEKVKPLLDAGNPLEAEVLLDQLISDLEKGQTN